MKAMKCDRCEAFSTDTETFRVLSKEGEIMKALFKISERFTADLCPSCTKYLIQMIRTWWSLA